MHCFLRGAPLSAHSNPAMLAFNLIPKGRKKTPNAQRPTPNVEFQKLKLIVRVADGCLHSVLDVRRWALDVFLPVSSLARSNARRLLCLPYAIVSSQSRARRSTRLVSF